MYAIAFDLNTSALETHYPGTHPNAAYDDIRREFKRHGFEWQQGSLYFGVKGKDPVHCVLAVQSVSKRYPWFAKVVRDIRMLRIEEHNNLLPAISEQDLFGDQQTG